MHRIAQESHKHPRQELAAYAGGDLAPEAARQVYLHLQGCAACRAEVADLRGAEARLRAWGGIDPRFAGVPYSAKQALRAQLVAGAPAPGRGSARAAWVVLSGVMVVLLVALGGQWHAPASPREADPAVQWTTFASGLGAGPVPAFSIDYPSNWNLTQTIIAPPSMTISLRFSTYKPPVGNLLALPGPDDAEIWLAVGQGSLTSGWPAAEVASLHAQGYHERQYRVGGIDALRLTDTTPHFGLYDAVYVPLGDSFMARVYLSAAATRYDVLFGLMLQHLQVDTPAPPTATLASSHPIPLYLRNPTGGTSTACGTQDYLENQEDTATSLGAMPDEDVCVNTAAARNP